MICRFNVDVYIDVPVNEESIDDPGQDETEETLAMEKIEKILDKMDPRQLIHDYKILDGPMWIISK